MLEWYRARGRQLPPEAPAVLVLDILDGRLRMARAVARGLSSNGIHAFVIHLPGQGDRGSRPALRRHRARGTLGGACRFRASAPRCESRVGR